jgi:hypothetical protein
MVPGCGTENFVSIETGGIIPLFVKKKTYLHYRYRISWLAFGKIKNYFFNNIE